MDKGKILSGFVFKHLKKNFVKYIRLRSAFPHAVPVPTCTVYIYRVHSVHLSRAGSVFPPTLIKLIAVKTEKNQ
jgi:hypothetical protein